MRCGLAGRLADVRVRKFELRLIAAGLVACWTLTALIVLLGYRPGGPVDLSMYPRAPASDAPQRIATLELPG